MSLKITRSSEKSLGVPLLHYQSNNCELQHMHYNIVCDVTNKTVFMMSSQWMIQ